MVLNHENILQRMEHWDLIRRVDPHRLKFCGEKTIGGGTHNVIGISSISSRDNTSPFFYYVHSGGRSNSDIFSDIVIRSIAVGHLRRGDVLVLNNASYHRGGEASNLEEYAWEDHGIYMHFLPPRSPDLNPAKLMLQSLTRELEHFPISDRRRHRDYGYYSPDRIVRAAMRIMDQITYGDVFAHYCRCNYIPYR